MANRLEAEWGQGGAGPKQSGAKVEWAKVERAKV